jgi:uncharacterized protein YjbI with pentapeptide repeats
MANQEHLDILKQGVEVWNQWRKDFPNICPDLGDAHLTETTLGRSNLEGINFKRANLNNVIFSEIYIHGAKFKISSDEIPVGTATNDEDAVWLTHNNVTLNHADLSESSLNGAILHGVNLKGARLRNATIIRADLTGADLTQADLHHANLTWSNLSWANLSETNLGEVNLSGVTFTRNNLSRANFNEASTLGTIFTNVDLRLVEGLETVRHYGPSFIGIETLLQSREQIPEVFLRGSGLPDTFIAYTRSLANHPINFYSCFISYSSKDDKLARRLHADLQAQGVRCWFAPKDMKIGDKIRARIDEAIHLQDKLLLLLSEHAIASTWVEDEVEAALEKEQRQQREVLFPVRLDENVMETTQPWAAKLRRTRHIGDFTHWTDPQAYQQAFERLLRDLKAESQEYRKKGR